MFAIAITLLVLDVRVPESEFEDLWRGIADQWPSYLAYVTSFLTIGALWLAHHGIFARLRFVDPTVMRINLVLLMAASFLTVILLLLAAMWRAVAAPPGLLRPEVGEREVDRILRRTAPSFGSYIAVTLLAIVAPHVAAFGYLLIAIVLVVRARGSDQTEDTAQGV